MILLDLITTESAILDALVKNPPPIFRLRYVVVRKSVERIRLWLMFRSTTFYGTIILMGLSGFPKKEMRYNFGLLKGHPGF